MGPRTLYSSNFKHHAGNYTQALFLNAVSKHFLLFDILQKHQIEV